jgi:hypothetical protein
MTSLTNNEILSKVTDILAYIKSDEATNAKKENLDKYLEDIGNKYADFKIMLPMLFDMIVTNGANFEMARLIDMLKRKVRIDNKESNHEAESKIVGKNYADEFVMPIANTIDNIKR